MAQADALVRFLQATGGSQVSAAADHSTQVFVFDPRAQLVMATPELPSGEEIARLLEMLAQAS